MNLDRPILSIAIIISSIILAIILAFQSFTIAIWIIVPAIFLVGYLNPKRFKPLVKNIDDYPVISRTRRRKLIATFTLAIIGIVISTTFNKLVEVQGTSEIYTGIFGIILIVCTILMIYIGEQLFRSRYAIALSENSNVDERDIQNVNKAYKLSFRIIILASVIIFLVIPEIFNTFIAKTEGSQDYWYFLGKISTSSTIFILILLFNLPFLVYAWLEPDPIPE